MKEIVFALLPRAILLDAAAPSEVFRSASRRVPGSYRLRFASPLHTLETASGLRLGELEPLPKALADEAIIVIPGLSGPLDFQDRANLRLIAWLAGGTAARAQLMCVGAGCLIAAKAGMLAGRECTTHPEHAEELRRIEPRAQVHDNRIFVADGPMLTCAGVAAGVDLALYVIGRELGSRVAVEVARDLVVYLRRSGTDPALSPWLMHRNHIHLSLIHI